MVKEDLLRTGGSARTFIRRGLAIAAVGAMVALTACSSGDDFGDGGGQGESGETDVVSTLPAEFQEAYVNLGQPVGPTPYVGDWAPRGEAPWTIGYASPYSGNSWQAYAMERLEELIPKYQEAGLIDEVIITQSNLDDTVQNQQIRQLVDQGADIIFTCCSSVTALNQSIEYAFDNGVPFVSYSGYIDSPYSINTSANYREAGRISAESLFEKMGGAGNVLDVVGVPGGASSDSFDAGVHDALEKFPDISIIGTVAGQWSDTVTKTEVQKFLATNSDPVDGIIVQPGSATGALQALQQSGREIVPVSVGGEAGALCYWKNNPEWIDEAFHIWPPGDELQLGFEVAIRTLQQQGPRIQSIVRNIAPLTLDEVNANFGDDCDENSNGWLQPEPGEWFSTADLDNFFENPADPLTWRP